MIARCAPGWAIALVGLIATLATLDEPGLTVDEPINLGHGQRFLEHLLSNGYFFTSANDAVRLWSGASEHPPLTRLLIGVGAGLERAMAATPSRHLPVGLLGGRAMSAFAFALLLAIAVALAARRDGAVAGVGAALAALTMPRLFGHAHLASPEMIHAACFLAALAAAGWALERTVVATPGLVGTATVWSLAGVVFGLALLTKLTAVVLAPGVMIAAAWWMIRRQPTALIIALTVWGLVGVAVFVLGWPWLWPFDLPGFPPGWGGSLARGLAFLGVAVQRATIYVWFFGEQYPSVDRPVPPSYVAVHFVLTVPLATHALALWGLCRASRRPTPSSTIWLSVLLVGWAVFSGPVAKYDGERLFLMLFPIWAIFAGLGASACTQWPSRWIPPWLSVLTVTVVLAAQGEALIRLRPCWLGYFNPLVGGLPGAAAAGLEPTYWGDSLTADMLLALNQRAGAGEHAILVPTLHVGHALMLGVGQRAGQGVTILPADRRAPHVRWAIVFNRPAYLQEDWIRDLLADGEIVAEVARDGVWLARVVRF